MTNGEPATMNVPATRRGFTLVELLTVVAIIGVLIAMLLPAVQAARESSRRVACANNLKQLGIAIQSYVMSNGRLPANANIPAGVAPPAPGTTSGTTGSATDQYYFNSTYEKLSAHYLLLPHLGLQSIFDLTNPNTNADWNAAKLQVRLPAFLCPSTTPPPLPAPGCHYGWSAGSVPYTWMYGVTQNYSGVWIPATPILQNGAITVNTQWTFANINDGVSNTLLGSEMLSGLGQATSASTATYPTDVFFTLQTSVFTGLANLAFPTDAELAAIGNAAIGLSGGVGSRCGWYWALGTNTLINTSAPPNWIYPNAGGGSAVAIPSNRYMGVFPPRSQHRGGVNAVMCDGAVRFVGDSVNTLTFQRLGHRRDGSSIDLDSL